ncbi:MAG: pyridoxamine 5'-phosphate oxidase family protein [Chloroflexia bacterium]|nr:pyridoxamine 5'-phosphate oxidase family protein [Chloroflexia bacterium]
MDGDGPSIITGYYTRSAEQEQTMDVERVKCEAARLSPWTHVATVGADGNPDVSPVHPAWEGDTIWFMAYGSSVKVRNIAHHPNVAMHWQVTEAGDGVEVWGPAEVFTDLDTKRRLWNGVFSYDLNLFAPGGPEGSPEVAFVAVRPERALYLVNYGIDGRYTWSA